MEKLGVSVVRFTPLIIYAIMCVRVVRSWVSEDYICTCALKGDVYIFSIALFFVSLSNKRSHCKWNRTMYVFISLVSIFDSINQSMKIIANDMLYSLIVGPIIVSVSIVTSFLAIRHFIRITKRKMNHGREQIRLQESLR
jgi:hypothetical protein